MSKYAIIKLTGKQFKVTKGDVFIVDRLDQEEDSTMTIDQVLMVKDDKETKIGQPFVEGASVELKIKEHQRSKKLRVAKYKAKSRYRRVKGHRQHQSVVEVTAIN